MKKQPIFIRKFWMGVFLIGCACLWSGPAFSGPSENLTDKPASNPGPQGAMGKKAHRIEVGDKLRVKIYPEDDYIKGGEMEVSSEGTITLALIGKISVQGMQVAEVEREIVQRLGQDYLVNPVVVLEVSERIVEKEKKSAAILGQVQKPGSYEIPTDQKLTLLQLISMAGGFTDIANAKKIKVVRKKDNETTVIHANAESIISGKKPDLELEPDDVIHVGESFF